MGSVFSPYYAFARRRGAAEPENHCALNVALYGRGGRWAMTERGRRAAAREASRFQVGPSDLVWDGTTLTIRIAEICAPIPRPLRGVVRVTPAALVGESFAIDGEGKHLWRPIAPLSQVEAEFDAPALSWRGEGYLDCNAGVEPLEAAFRTWTWGRARTSDGSKILYDVERRRGGPLALALEVGRDGAVRPFDAPPKAPLPGTFWRVARETRSDAGSAPCVVGTLEDTPFYNRSRLTTRLQGEEVTMMHESLSLDRFAHPVVQMMLPFRMPRRG